MRHVEGYRAKHGRAWRLTGCGALFWELGARNGDAILMWRSPDGDGRTGLNCWLPAGGGEGGLWEEEDGVED